MVGVGVGVVVVVGGERRGEGAGLARVVHGKRLACVTQPAVAPANIRERVCTHGPRERWLL